MTVDEATCSLGPNHLIVLAQEQEEDNVGRQSHATVAVAAAPAFAATAF